MASQGQGSGPGSYEDDCYNREDHNAPALLDSLVGKGCGGFSLVGRGFSILPCGASFDDTCLFLFQIQ
jgi:hypothetical protein